MGGISAAPPFVKVRKMELEGIEPSSAAKSKPVSTCVEGLYISELLILQPYSEMQECNFGPFLSPALHGSLLRVKCFQASHGST